MPAHVCEIPDYPSATARRAPIVFAASSESEFAPNGHLPFNAHQEGRRPAAGPKALITTASGPSFRYSKTSKTVSRRRPVRRPTWISSKKRCPSSQPHFQRYRYSGARIRPQLTQLVDAAPEAAAWLHEIKYDGYRIHARLDRGAVKLLTRTGLERGGVVRQLGGAIRAAVSGCGYANSPQVWPRGSGTRVTDYPSPRLGPRQSANG
jgi:hypothetical protein